MLRLTCLASAVFALSVAPQALAQQPPSSPTPTTAPGAENQQQDVMLRAEQLTEDIEKNIVTAEGEVEVRVGPRALRADRLVYDRNNQTMRAYGKVELKNEDGTIQFSEEIEVDEDFRNAFATRFSTRLAGNAIATASSAVRQDGTKNILEQVVYTGCPICKDTGGEPTWSLRARRAVLDQESQMITYQDAVLEIKGVPVLYVPWFAHPDPSSKRRSGFLTPDMGISSRLGPFYEQPYYWAISPSEDLTISPLIMGEVNPLVKLDYRKRFFSGIIQAEGSFTHEQDFNSDGDQFGDDTWRSHLYALGRFNINQDWKWGFGVERQTDDLYDQRYDIDGEDDIRGLWASQPRQLLSQIYATGQQEDFYFEAGMLAFQGLRAFDDDAEFPRVAPSIFAEKIFDFGPYGDIATEFSTIALFRDEREELEPASNNPANPRPARYALDTARATASAEWNSQYIFGPGFVVSPFASGRGDFYRFDDGGVEGEQIVTRALGVAGTQVSWPLIHRGETVDWIVEPIGMVAYGTDNANDDGIPNEDSILIEQDESNLFKPNAVTNYDLWEGGLRASIGVSTTARFGKDNSVTVLAGRRWRAEDDPAFNQTSNLAKKQSDYVASVRTEIGRTFTAGARMRFDEDLTFNRIDAEAGVNVWRLNGSARYFKVLKPSVIPQPGVSDEDEAIAINGSFRITDRWSALYTQARNITNKQNIQLSLGIAYRDECSFFAISYERNGTQDRTLGPSDSIRFQFVLTGLGGIS